MFLSDPPPFLKTFGLLMLQGDQKQKLGRNGLTSVFVFLVQIRFPLTLQLHKKAINNHKFIKMFY